MVVAHVWAYVLFFLFLVVEGNVYFKHILRDSVRKQLVSNYQWRGRKHSRVSVWSPSKGRVMKK